MFRLLLHGCSASAAISLSISSLYNQFVGSAMESDRVSLMLMYEDESVDVRCGNVQLQLSPCGCEFMLVKPAEASQHPLLPPERVRQRTRFTVSTYKEFLVAALDFRNKYASGPYLPEELIPADQKKPFCSIDTDVQWPDWSSSEAELGPGGETIVRSKEGRAALMLSPSGEEFTVEFTCRLSQSQRKRSSMQVVSRDPDKSQSNTSNRSRSCSPRIIPTAHPKPEEMYQSTTVVQHHSCSAVPPVWRHPLSLARHLWTARLSEPEDVSPEGANDPTKTHDRINLEEASTAERRSHLPQALPLTCPAPHWHRWEVKEQVRVKEQSEQDLPAGLVKVMWFQGVTYRILSGAVSVVEVSPGDGSVIRSNGVFNTYFTHHKPELLSGQVKDITYHLNNLPPDVPGQLYSIRSVVSRAGRILTCYNEAKHSLMALATPSCLQEGRDFSKAARTEENLVNVLSVEQHLNVSQMAGSRSDLVAAELEKIKRFNFLLENNHLLRSEAGTVHLGGSSAEEVTKEPLSDDSIAEALQKTSKAIQDLDALISAAALT